MKKALFCIVLILIFGFVFGQTRQAGQNLLQGEWNRTDYFPTNYQRYKDFFIFKGNRVIIMIDGDHHGDEGYLFTYENANLILTRGDSSILMKVGCFVTGNKMVLVFDNGWWIFEKSR